MEAKYDVKLGTLFVFINKYCFEGLFNRPYTNSRRMSIDEKNIMEISKYLQGVAITDGDFVFVDRLYASLNPTSFESYTKEGFDIESHKHLTKFYG